MWSIYEKKKERGKKGSDKQTYPPVQDPEVFNLI